MEIQKTEVAKNPEIEEIIELTKQKQSEEVEHCDEQQKQAQDAEEDELRNLLLADIGELPISPPSATQVNFVSYFITGSQIRLTVYLQTHLLNSVTKPLFQFSFWVFRFYETGSRSVHLPSRQWVCHQTLFPFLCFISLKAMKLVFLTLCVCLVC